MIASNDNGGRNRGTNSIFGKWLVFLKQNPRQWMLLVGQGQKGTLISAMPHPSCPHPAQQVRPAPKPKPSHLKVVKD
jgi:hypothetical protein